MISNYYIIVTALVATLAYLYSKWKHTHWQRLGVPQLQPKFFFGNMKNYITGQQSFGEAFLDMYNEFRRKGVDYGGVYIGYRTHFFPVSPDLVKDIMQKNFDHFTGRFGGKVNQSVFSKSVFHLKGDLWKSTRRLLTPTFTSGKMKMMFETLLEKTAGLVEIAEENVGGAVNVKDILGRFTSDVIGSVGFGIECNAIRDPDSEFLTHGRFIVNPSEKKDTLWTMFLKSLGRNRRDFKPSENFFKNMVKETIDYREKNQVYRKDFMHLMIQLKNLGKVSDDQAILSNNGKLGNFYGLDDITAQVLIFFIAGYETSATTMSFALYELAQHPEMQDKLRKEANDVLDKYQGKLTYDALAELTYTEQVIEETLRKYPPLTWISRLCTKDYTIPGTETVIKKGTMTHLPVWGLQMDPQYFPDPHRFDPERFNKTNKPLIKSFTYIPFGEGPRLCLGMRFGMMQTKVGLVTLIKNYKFSLNEKTPVPIRFQKNSFVLGTADGIWMDIEKA